MQHRDYLCRWLTSLTTLNNATSFSTAPHFDHCEWRHESVFSGGCPSMTQSITAAHWSWNRREARWTPPSIRRHATLLSGGTASGNVIANGGSETISSGASHRTILENGGSIDLPDLPLSAAARRA